jgi:hypothetical protein
MKISQGIHDGLEYHNLHSKNTTRTDPSILSKLTTHFGDRYLDSLTPEQPLGLAFRGFF